MGQTLSSPATDKTSESGGDARFYYAISEMQGWRITMEDAHAIVLNLDEEKKDANSFFAVYDGHGGGLVARYAGSNVHKRLLTENAYQDKDYGLALKNAFLGTDEDMRSNPGHLRDPSGCTAVAALVADGKIYVANAGDSRSVISVKGQVKPLSYDHKPSGDIEKARITAAGGYIEYGRVNGNLALSRALGDFEFKKNANVSAEKQVITADPDIIVHDFTDEDEFLVLACDGIWDCLSSQQVVDFIRYRVSEGKDLTEIGEAMMEHCLAPDTTGGAGIGCDNMTIMIIALLHGRTKEEWYTWVTDRVKQNYGYTTPAQPPQLYAQSRLMSFRTKRENIERREREQRERDGGSAPDRNVDNGNFLGGGAFGGLARVLGAGGISFHSGGGIMSDSAGLMFGSEDSDEDEDDDEEMETDGAEGASIFGDGQSDRPHPPDATKGLEEHLSEFEKGLKDGDSEMGDAELATPTPTPGHAQAEAPPAPKPDAAAAPAEQPAAGGDEAHPAVKAEGLLDTSEDPLVSATKA